MNINHLHKQIEEESKSIAEDTISKLNHLLKCDELKDIIFFFFEEDDMFGSHAKLLNFASLAYWGGYCRYNNLIDKITFLYSFLINCFIDDSNIGINYEYEYEYEDEIKNNLNESTIFVCNVDTKCLSIQEFLEFCKFYVADENNKYKKYLLVMDMLKNNEIKK